MKVGELVERIRSNTDARSAKEELYRVLQAALLERLRGKIPPRLHCRLDAEDVLHDAFLRALDALDRFQSKGEDSFLAWVYCIAKNLILDVGKRRSVMALRLSPSENGSGAGKAKGLRESQIVPRKRSGVESELARRDWIESKLGKLNAREALVIRLRDLRGHSYEEIAASWGSTPGAVQKCHSRARQRLRDLAKSEPG